MGATEYESILSSAAALESEGDCMAALNEYEQAIDANHERPEAYLEAAKMLLRHDGIWESNKQIIKAKRAIQYLKDALRWNTLQHIPHQMNVLTWSVGPEGVSKLREKFGE
jgi:predicted Zn-dependent peptidase